MKYALLCALVCLLAIQTSAFPQTTQTSKRNKRGVKATKLRAIEKSPLSSLPIRRVILYSNGVAYVERRGLVTGHAEVSLSFKQSQVDDVLKSMVVLDLGRGRIGAVSYNSSAPASSRLSEIPFAISAATDGNNGGGLAGVLSQLQGARVVVSTASRSETGAILTVEAKQSQIDADKPPVTSHRLVIASDNGEVSGFDLAELRSVQLVDEGSRRDLNEFAHAAAAARRRDAKTIIVTSDGVGEREMLVSYTIAAPIWKTTYRVVLDDRGTPFFQGWAIVDNISEEDWNGIQLSLVSGTPVSFIQQIQNPVYRYRPIIPLQPDVNMTPQTYEPGEVGATSTGSLKGTVKDQTGSSVPGATVTVTNTATNQSFQLTTNSEGEYVASALPPGKYSARISASGFKDTIVNDLNVLGGLRSNYDVALEVGALAETVTITSSNNFQLDSLQNRIQQLGINGRSVHGLSLMSPGVSSYRPPISNLVSSGQAGVEVQTSASDVGDLFEYRIEQPVTVQRDRSALIPILQTRMEGERVSIFNEQSPANRPLSGLLLKNTSALTLDNGALTVIDGDAYAGEALMERLKPQEDRLISFAVDLGTLVNVTSDEDRQPTYMLKVHNGVAAAYYYNVRKKTYTIVNQTDRPRTVVIEHPISTWALTEDTAKPTLKTAKHYRFRLTVGSHEKLEFPVAEREEKFDAFALSDFTKTQLDLFIASRYIDEPTRQILEKLIDLKTQIVRIDVQLQEKNRQATTITQDQARLRENIQTLNSTAEARQLIARYVAKANDQETTLESIEKERQRLNDDRQRLQNELAAMIRGLSFDRRVSE